MKEDFNKETNQQENPPSKKKKNSKNDIIIKILTVACVICAVALIGVIVLAFVGDGGNNVTSGNVTPANVISTTEPVSTSDALTTTQPSTQGTTAPASNLVYATEQVNVRSGPSTDYEALAVLSVGESATLVSVNDDGWCEVIYKGTTCYIHRDYLSRTNPSAATQPSDVNTTRKTVNPQAKYWYLVVVDKTRQLPEGFAPELEYVASSETEQLDSRVVPYYDAMVNAALEDGVELEANSGFRSYETQQSNLNSLIQEYMYEYDIDEAEATIMAEKEILPAGCSEHNYGLAMDIGFIDESFRYTEAYEWLDAHAHEYGFIERYTEGKQSITNIIPEPWHWRFVGPEHAAKIKNAGISLEEYLQYYNVAY